MISIPPCSPVQDIGPNTLQLAIQIITLLGVVVAALIARSTRVAVIPIAAKVSALSNSDPASPLTNGNTIK